MTGSRPAAAQDSVEELVRRAAGGDVAAFARIVRLHNEGMTRVVYVIVGDQDVAAGATEAAWFGAWHSLRRKRSAQALGSWLCSLAAAEAIEVARRRPAQGDTAQEPGARSTDLPADDSLVEALARLDPGGSRPARVAPCRRAIDGRACPIHAPIPAARGDPAHAAHGRRSAGRPRRGRTRWTSIAWSASASALTRTFPFAMSTRTRRRAGLAPRSRSSARGWSRSPLRWSSACSSRCTHTSPGCSSGARRRSRRERRPRIAMNV